MGGKVKKKAPLFGNICTQFLLFFFFSSYWPIHPNIHHLLPSQPQVPSPSTTISTPLFISPVSPLANVIQPNHLFHFEATLSCNLRRYQVYLSKISTIYDQNRLNITENIKLNEMANIDRIWILHSMIVSSSFTTKSSKIDNINQNHL